MPTKLTQAKRLIERVARCFENQTPLLVICDSWFGNNGLFRPLREELGARMHLRSRLRVNAALYALPTPAPGKAGRPRKYGARLGNAAGLAERSGRRRQAIPCMSMAGYARSSPPSRW